MDAKNPSGGNWSKADLEKRLKFLKPESVSEFVIWCFDNKYIPTASCVRMFLLNVKDFDVTVWEK
jgi:hypothetical protein